MYVDFNNKLKYNLIGNLNNNFWGVFILKRILSFLLAVLTLLSLTVLSGCSGKETLKFGMGVNAYIDKATSADADTNGEGAASITVAAVLLDKDGKVVKSVKDITAGDDVDIRLIDGTAKAKIC